MDVLFHDLLKELQHQYPSVIPNSVNIEESYSTYQSLRQGAMSEVQNVDMFEEVTNANNRWRNK